MKKVLITILTLVAAFSLAGAGWAGPPPMLDATRAGKTQVTCPVQQGRINKEDLYVDYKGQRIYFCCEDCISIFNKNPEAYLKRMQQAGVTPEKSPGGK